MTDRGNEQIVVEPASPTVGERLQQAREAKKYSVAEVAAQLRLTKDIVEALETQQWDKLHGRTYARGYFSSYVKFLGLPHDEMLAMFNLEYTATEPALTLTSPGQQAQKTFPWLAVLMVIILALVLWFAYQQWQKTQQAEQAAQVQSRQNEGDAFSNSVVEPLQSAPTTEFDADSLLPQSEPSPEAVEYEQIETGMPPASEVDEATAVDVDLPMSVFSEQRAPDAVASAESTLRVSVSDACWVEVTTQASEVLVSKLMQADETLQLSSAEQLNVLLGKASAAVVLFNDEAVELAPHTHGEVARLTLGVES